MSVCFIVIDSCLMA